MNRRELLKILELDEDASASDIESSFLLLSKLWQADRFEDNDELSIVASIKRREITCAYRSLTNTPIDIEPDSLGFIGRSMNGGEDCNPGLSDDNFISENEQASSLRIWPIAIFCILCMLVSAAAITRSLAPKASNKQEVKPRVASKGTPNLKLKRPSLPRSAQSFNIKFSEDTLRLKDKHIVFARVSEDMFKQRDAIYLLSNEGNVTKSFKSFTPDLIDASIRCDQELTATLLEDAVDLELTDTVGDTALIWAVRRSCLPIVKMLIKKGADVNATSRNGFTPYVWSRLYRSKEISKLLVKAGATIDGGIYWWRHEDDGEDKWLDRALSNACRNRNCDLD